MLSSKSVGWLVYVSAVELLEKPWWIFQRFSERGQFEDKGLKQSIGFSDSFEVFISSPVVEVQQSVGFVWVSEWVVS